MNRKQVKDITVEDRITDPEALAQALQAEAEGADHPASRALFELCRKGMVVDSGRRRPNRNGKLCIVLVARDAATKR